MKKIIMMAALLLTVSAFAQKPAGDPKGGISADLLKEISKGFEGTPADIALQNALNSAQIIPTTAGTAWMRRRPPGKGIRRP